MYVHSVYICASLTYVGPSDLTANIMKNIESLSIVVQWDAVNDSLPTTYTIIWNDEGDLFEVTTLIEQTSYTITGLTLDTVYTISVTASNMCSGDGAEFSTMISFPTGTAVYMYVHSYVATYVAIFIYHLVLLLLLVLISAIGTSATKIPSTTA